MKKIAVITMIMAMGLGCLAGCGREESTKSFSDAVYVPAEAAEETKCYHENTDAKGICLDCGEDAGAIIGKDEFHAYFDMVMQPKRGYINGFDIVIAPRSGYENATFENVCVTVYGTKLDHDGFSRNRDSELVSVDLDEKGTGTFTGFIDDYISTDYVEVGPCLFGAPRIHYRGGSSAPAVYEVTEDTIPDVEAGIPKIEETRIGRIFTRPNICSIIKTCEVYHEGRTECGRRHLPAYQGRGHVSDKDTCGGRGW